MAKTSFGDVVVQDFWVHVAGVIAIALGAVSWYMRTHFGADPSSLELMFMVGGFGTMGVKLINGSAAQLRQASLDTAFQAARAAQTAATAAQIATTPPVADAQLTAPQIAAIVNAALDARAKASGSASPPAAPAAQGGSTSG